MKGVGRISYFYNFVNNNPIENHPNEITSQNVNQVGWLTKTMGFDNARVQLEYPEDIDLYGVSFNTSPGNYSIQGEVAYRPNIPFQVNTADLAFSALDPSLSYCDQTDANCTGPALFYLPRHVSAVVISLAWRLTVDAVIIRKQQSVGLRGSSRGFGPVRRKVRALEKNIGLYLTTAGGVFGRRAEAVVDQPSPTDC